MDPLGNSPTGYCIQCPPGTIAVTTGNGCEPCAAGTYKENIGDPTCSSCPTDTPLSLPGASKSSDCKKVCGTAGHGLDFLDANQCTKCPAGYQQSNKGSGCELCPAGSYSDAGAEKCKACPDATPLSLTGASDVSHCRPECEDDGKGLDPNDRAKCLFCLAGFYKAKAGNGCRMCEAGTYSIGGANKCEKCSDKDDSRPLSLPGAKSEDDCLPTCGNGQGYRLTGAAANTGRFFKLTH